MAESPHRAYLVCATQRSGSTVLCETLRATAVAGVPREHFELLRHSGRPRQPREWMSGPGAPDVGELLPPPQPPSAGAPEAPHAWWQRIVRDGCTANGVWGGKLMWDHVDDLLARARALDGLAGADLAGALDALFGDLLLVHVRREDTVAQAISLWRALQTGSWRSETDRPGVQIVYHHEAIAHLVTLLERHEEAWLRWFETTGRRPLTLVYEQLSDDIPGAVGEVLGGLGLPQVELPPPALSRQRDDISRAWARRFRAERDERPRAASRPGATTTSPPARRSRDGARGRALPLPHDAAEADVAGRRVDRLALARGGAVAQAVVGRAEVGAALDRAARHVAAGLAGAAGGGGVAGLAGCAGRSRARGPARGRR